MRNDLLEAHACVDWAVAQLPSFANKIAGWLDSEVYMTVKDTEPPSTKNVVVAVEKEPLPFAFNVEFGAYLNVLRSSLDILAVALGRRFQVTNAEKLTFPIVDAFSKFKDRHLVVALPQTERALLESLKPYQGGNDLLWLLHDFDIKRKHRNLIDVSLRPTKLSVRVNKWSGTGPVVEFTPIFMKWISSYDETVVALVNKHSAWPNYNFKLTRDIAIREPGILEHRPIVEVLHNFASLASSIILLFDN